MRPSHFMIVRNFILGEKLPEQLKTGFEMGKCDPDWIWVVERDGELVGLLVAAPAHVMAILIRLVNTKNARGSDIRALILGVFREIKKRGYMGYTVWLDPTKEPENRFIGIIRAIGGFQLLNPQIVCCGGL